MGSQLLAAAAAAVDLADQERLRRHFPAAFCPEAMTLATLRREGRVKFERADELYFDREGLEMATRESVAAHRAHRFRDCGTVVDLCCGVGGDAMVLGRQSRVIAVDRDRRRLEMARLNCTVVGAAAAFVQADATGFEPKADAAFIDPERRRESGGGRGRIRAGAVYSPPLSFVRTLRQRYTALAVKVAPGIPEDELPEDAEVEFVSAAGQCREGVIYCGALASARRRATVLPGPHSIVSAENRGPAPQGPFGAFIYDPDPAVVRAHLIDELAGALEAWKLDPQIAYLSGDRTVDTPFARCYRVLRHVPFNLKSLRRLLGREGWRPTAIKKRRFPITPDELERLLRLEGTGEPVTLIATRIAERPVVAVCEPVVFSADSDRPHWSERTPS